METSRNSKMSTIIISWILMVCIFWGTGVESKCRQGCDALASYYMWPNSYLFNVALQFSTTLDNIVAHNPWITTPDAIEAGKRVNVPFSCGCVTGDFMGHQFVYKVKVGDYYDNIASQQFSNLTTVEMMMRFNSYPPYNIPDNANLNVVVNCSCGDSRVSKDYGLFVTYPLLPDDSLSSIANQYGLPQRLLQDYNPGVDFGSGSGLVFVPGKDRNGTYPPLKSSSSGISGGAIAGISVVAIIGAISLVAACVYFLFYKTRKPTEESFLHNGQNIDNVADRGIVEKASKSSSLVDKSMEFTFDELAAATNDFNISYKIGQGGFGAVYYAELRGKKAAIKKMGMQASKEFVAELKVLTRVHHMNLVRLIGYCTKGSLFLVYEFVENGTLSQHLHGKVREGLPWITRLQIALDSARGLEYIHEHTVPMYIHRDIKSANILIDGNFHAKVADFGLAKLTEVGGASLQTRLVGTFGYMPPEYARYGDVSFKVDVFAFGVVLFELISGKEAIVKSHEVENDAIGLVALFEEAFKQPDQVEAIRKLIDPRLGHEYTLDSVTKVAHLAKACTHENPQSRPTMRSIVVALMTLSSSSGHSEIASFYDNQGLVHLTSDC